MRSDMVYEKDESNFPTAGMFSFVSRLYFHYLAQQQQLAQAQQQALNDEANYYQQEETGYGSSYFNSGSSSRYDEPYTERRGSKFSKRHPTFEDSIVLMVYGINHDNFDCERLFNLLCCYGNVVKVTLIWMLILV